MAETSATTAKMARLLAIIQILTGCLLLCFGIADRLVPGGVTGYAYFGVWIGIWMCITGALGIPGSGRERTNTRNSFAGVFMGFSITSAVFGGMIIIFYSIGISVITSDNVDMYVDDYTNSDHHGKLAILAIMLILGIATFGIGIWAAICTCLLKPCCEQPQGEHHMYHNNPVDRYVISQPPGGVPVTIPMQPGGYGAASQGSHQPAMPVPISGTLGGQQLIVQAVSSERMATGTPQQQFQSQLVHIQPNSMSSTDSSPQEAEIPRSFRHGGYALLRNEEKQVDV